MAAVTGVIRAHGGLAGLLVEGGLVLLMVAVGVAVWWRGRRAGDE